MFSSFDIATVRVRCRRCRDMFFLLYCSFHHSCYFFLSCSALHTTTMVPQDRCTCWISVDLITLKGTVATQWIWQYQFKSKKKNTLIPRIWVLWTVFLGINGEAGRGVRGVAPEVTGEGHHRPADLCAEVQEAPRVLPQAGAAPSRRPDITPLISGQTLLPPLYIPALSFLFYTLLGPVLWMQLLLVVVWGACQRSTGDHMYICLAKRLTFGCPGVYLPSDQSWIHLR